MSESKNKWEKDFYSESELTDEKIDQLNNDPHFFRDEWGFHRCISEKDLRKMSKDELTHLIRYSDNDLDVTNATDEMNRRQHKLNLQYNIIGGVIAGGIVAIIQCIVQFFVKR